MNGHDNTDRTLIFMFMCWKDSVRNLIRVCPTDCGNVIQILPSGVRHSQINVLYFGVSRRDDDDPLLAKWSPISKFPPLVDWMPVSGLGLPTQRWKSYKWVMDIWKFYYMCIVIVLLPVYGWMPPYFWWIGALLAE